MAPAPLRPSSPSAPLRPTDRARQARKNERRKENTVTEDGLKEILNRLLLAVLREMGVLPVNKAAEKGKTASVKIPPKPEPWLKGVMQPIRGVPPPALRRRNSSHPLS